MAVQAPGKFAGTGISRGDYICLRRLGEVRGMAVWEGRLAFARYRKHVIHVCDLSLAQISVFGKQGKGRGMFRSPTRLHAHPNGNLLVVEEGNERVQEVTWKGGHVRFIWSVQTNGWEPTAVAVSPDSKLIAVGVRCESSSRVELLSERTCASVGCIDIGENHPVVDMKFSPDSTQIGVAIANGKARVYPLHGACIPTLFGENAYAQGLEFTDCGDIVRCASAGGITSVCVYSGTTLEPLRTWTLPIDMLEIVDMQAHAGSLYVICEPHWACHTLLYVYE